LHWLKTKLPWRYDRHVPYIATLILFSLCWWNRFLRFMIHFWKNCDCLKLCCRSNCTQFNLKQQHTLVLDSTAPVMLLLLIASTMVLNWRLRKGFFDLQPWCQCKPFCSSILTPFNLSQKISQSFYGKLREEVCCFITFSSEVKGLVHFVESEVPENWSVGLRTRQCCHCISHRCT
jgi:hypothetical protein